MSEAKTRVRLTIDLPKSLYTEWVEASKLMSTGDMADLLRKSIRLAHTILEAQRQGKQLYIRNNQFNTAEHIHFIK